MERKDAGRLVHLLVKWLAPAGGADVLEVPLCSPLADFNFQHIGGVRIEIGVWYCFLVRHEIKPSGIQLLLDDEESRLLALLGVE